MPVVVALFATFAAWLFGLTEQRLELAGVAAIAGAISTILLIPTGVAARRLERSLGQISRELGQIKSGLPRHADPVSQLSFTLEALERRIAENQTAVSARLTDVEIELRVAGERRRDAERHLVHAVEALSGGSHLAQALLAFAEPIEKRIDAMDEASVHRSEHLSAELWNHYRQLESLFSIYGALDIGTPLPPFRGWAVSPDLAAALVHAIILDRPQTIIEAGSGLSTVLAGYAAARIGSRVLALEHEAMYAAATQRMIATAGLEGSVTVLHAPLREYSIGGSTWLWYETNGIAHVADIDLLLVDGPPKKTQPLARYPALPLLWSRLSERALVIMDDGSRDSEKATVEKWCEEHPELQLSSLPHEKGTTMLRRSADARLATQ